MKHSTKYKLVEKQCTKRNIFIITLIADSNDADYITEKMNYKKEEFESNIDELINLRVNYGGSHQLKTYPNEKEFDIPCNDWDYSYCHTLEELRVEYVDENGKIWDVEF